MSYAGIEYTISSDGFFELEHQPKNVVVVGAGYIAVELSGIFNALGSKVSLLIRGEMVSNLVEWGWCAYVYTLISRSSEDLTV